MSPEAARAFVVMGVSGCGKTTVGRELAAILGCPFYDGDDFHPPENVAKMARGVPLDDDDRAPWLAALAALIAEHLARGETAVLACSALKERYRAQLRVTDAVQFIYLEGDFDTIWARMKSRSEHYMKAEMLHSQFADLEVPADDEVIRVTIDRPVSEIVASVLDAIT